MGGTAGRKRFSRHCRGWLASLSAVLCGFSVSTSCQRPAPRLGDQRVEIQGSTDVAPDEDGDRVDDRLEDLLAERFAPVVFHGERETVFPTTVDSWLRRANLAVMDQPRHVRIVVAGPLRQTQLIDVRAMAGELAITSSGTRTRGKKGGFFVEAAAGAVDSTPNPGEWVTYVHSYPNRRGGLTLQYWRAYTQDDARFLGIDFGHGGDWEAVSVHLDADQRPARTTYLDHAGIADVTQRVTWRDGHPQVWSEEGGHASYPDASHSQSTRWYRQETWTGGVVTRWNSAEKIPGGGLINVGEKSRPRNGQVFVRYSGLWGAPAVLFMTSGYWGPAFNETGATCANGASAYVPYLLRPAERQSCGPIWINAWCDDADSNRLDLRKECHADSEIP
jgi:hypothetical protein